MKRMSSLKNQAIVLFTVLCIALSPIAMQLHAQTPGAEPPPPPAAEVPPPPAEEPPPPPAEEPPPPPAEDPPPPPAEEPPPPPAEDPPQPPAEEPPPPPAEDPPPPAEEPPPPADDPGDSPDDGSEVIEPSEEATDEPTTESTEEPTTEATEESTSEATEEATETVEAEGDSTPDAEVEEESSPATPTPTEEVIVPDELQIVGDTSITINAGEYKDIVIRYTLGSDREKTEMSANLTAPGGESLDDWFLVPWQRADLDEDPQDANRGLRARIDYADSTENGDIYETTWRVTAPDHIEKPVTVRMHLSTKIHRDDGITDGVIKNDFVSINAVASQHIPTLACDEVIAEDVDNTWNCAFDTTHPDEDVVITASAEVPEGWELTLDDDELNSEPLALSAEAIAADGFTIAATYPIGCPDIGATFITSVSLSITYPSGEVSEIDIQLPLVFERPIPTFEITSFEFDEMDLTQTLSTTGRMTVSYEDVPCAWQATLQLTDLESDMATIPSDLIRIDSVEGLPDASVSIQDGSITIHADDAADENASGIFTIHIGIDLPYQIPPGAYRIGVTTQFGWADQD